MKIFPILAVLVAVIYAVVWEIPVMKWGYEVSTVEQGGKAGEVANLAELMKGPAPKRWWNDRVKLNDTFNTSFLSDARRASITVALPLEELLLDDQPMPEDVFKDVYAAALAPAHMIGICAELLATVAVKCDLSHPEGKIARDGLTELTGRLRYVPRDDPGELPQTSQAEYLDLLFSLSDGADVPFTPEARQNAMNVARLLCKALRAQAGNCVITRIRMKPQRNARSKGQQLLEASTVLTVYADPAQVDEKALKETLTQVRGIMGL